MTLPKSWGITFYKKEPWDLERGETEYRIVGVHVNIYEGKTLEKYKYWTTIKLHFLYKRASNIVYINIPIGLWELFKIPYLPNNLSVTILVVMNRLRGLNENLFSCISGGWKSQTWQGWFLVRSLSLSSTCRWPSFPCIFTWSSSVCLCPRFFLEEHESYWIKGYPIDLISHFLRHYQQKSHILRY